MDPAPQYVVPEISDELRTVIGAAFARARRQRHKQVSPEHLLHGMSEDSRIGGTLEVLGVDLGVLRRDLAAALAERPRRLFGVGEPVQSPELDQILRLAVAHAMSAERPWLYSHDALVSLSSGPPCVARALLARHGVSRLHLTTYLSHGLTPYQAEQADRRLRESTAPGRLRVVLQNDHYTTRDFVVRVLREVFSFDEARAAALMLDTHRRGSADLGVFPAQTARTLTLTVHGRAREQGFPLRCVLERE